MTETGRIFRISMEVTPLRELHLLDPDVAEDEFLALGGTQWFLICAADQASAKVLAEDALSNMHPLIHAEVFDVEIEHHPLSAHDQMQLLQEHPDLCTPRTCLTIDAPSGPTQD